MGILSSANRSGMRAVALVVAAVLALMMALVATGSVLATQAQAAPNPEYKYTVRIYAGAQGSFNGQNSVVVTNDAKPGDRIAFNQGSVTLDNGSKYYIRGVREAGRDNDTSLTTPSFVITGDTDLVVSYGVLGDNVKYTVQYVDEDGNALLPSETFYGNVGDSPVIAYRYIEGYAPQAYNLTGKLLSDESKNVYTFTYTPGEQPEAPAPNPAQPAPAIVAPVPGEGDADPVATVVPEADIPDGANPLAGGDQPADIQDIRDDENPLAFFENLIGDEAGLVTLQEAAPLIAGLLGALILAIVILVIFRKRRKNQELAYQTARSEVMTDDGRNGTSKLDSSDNGSGGNGRTV